MEPIQFWSTTINSKEDYKNKSSQPKVIHCVYQFGLIINEITCPNCLKKIKSYTHRCIINTKRNTIWLSKKTIKQKEFFEKFLKQKPPLYKICEHGDIKYRFHSRHCINHINQKNIIPKFICRDYVLYEQIPIPKNFTIQNFKQRKFVHPIEAYLQNCNHK